MPLRLTITSYHKLTPGQRAEFELDRGELKIGRNPENDWILPDPERLVSGQHCVIQLRDGTYYLTDTSTNGVHLVNAGVRMHRGNSEPLQDGELLRVGEYDILVQINGAPQIINGAPGMNDPFTGFDALMQRQAPGEIPGTATAPPAGYRSRRAVRPWTPSPTCSIFSRPRRCPHRPWPTTCRPSAMIFARQNHNAPAPPGQRNRRGSSDSGGLGPLRRTGCGPGVRGAGHCANHRAGPAATIASGTGEHGRQRTRAGRAAGCGCGSSTCHRERRRGAGSLSQGRGARAIAYRQRRNPRPNGGHRPQLPAYGRGVDRGAACPCQPQG